MQWFGKAFGAPYEFDTPRVRTPVGTHCAWCGEPVAEHDDGFLIPVLGRENPAAYHYECHLRTIIGGVNHLLHLCRCTGCAGVLPPDPPGMTRREAAHAALATSARMKLGGEL